MKEIRNIAFIDGQNLYLGTSSEGWSIDLHRFRIFLRDRFGIVEAYYFLGCVIDEEQYFYNALQKAGFIVVFREHATSMLGKKKGNVDTDIVFEMMRRLYKENDFQKILLVSWDGDYFKVVRFLIDEGRFAKILFPNKHHSSLYKSICSQYGINLSLPDFRKKFEYKKREI